MDSTTIAQRWRWLLQVCRGEFDLLAEWITRRDANLVWSSVVAICVGCGLYGFTLGMWRSPLMGAYVSIKLPLAIFGVVGINGMLNGVLAQLLGTGLGFRQTLMMILASFALFALIVGSVAPVSFFASLNLPGAEAADAGQWHGMVLVFHTGVIAFAGLICNLKLLRLMLQYVPNRRSAVQTFVGWTLGNLLVGAQVFYVCRPFFGDPDLEVEFFRRDALSGNFYYGVLGSAEAATGLGAPVLIFLALLAGLFAVVQLRRIIRELLTDDRL